MVTKTRKPKMADCAVCNGTGVTGTGRTKTCKYCKGTGEVEITLPEKALKQPDCIACEGTGISSSGRECYPCDGTGKRKMIPAVKTMIEEFKNGTSTDITTKPRC